MIPARMVVCVLTQLVDTYVSVHLDGKDRNVELVGTILTYAAIFIEYPDKYFYSPEGPDKRSIISPYKFDFFFYYYYFCKNML